MVIRRAISLIFIFSIYLLPSAHALRFSEACESGDQLMIGAVGDVLLHGPLQKQGYKQGFSSLWQGLLPFMEGPDVMYANLEGPAAAGINKSGKAVKDPGLVFDANVYSGYPLFNYNPIIIEDLLHSGVDIVSTANNHSLDRKAIGLRSTMDSLNSYGMPYIGTRYSADEDFYTITKNGTWTLGWIACAYGTNGIPDKEDLVLDCFDGRVTKLIKNLKDSVDAVIVTPHWGDEYQLSPNSNQKKFAKQWIEDGAQAIIGSHPHVPQPWEKHITSDKREGLILYSLGNFVSNQSSTKKQSSLLLYVGLSKNNGRTWVNGVRYLPLFMKRAGGYEALASNFVVKPSSEVKASLQLITKMFGDERIIQPGEDVVTNAECY
jgi:hypothetical protein